MIVGAAILAVVLLAVPSSAVAEGFRLAPYKDELFAYPVVVGTKHGGDFVMIEFNEERDINGRDEIPLKKAWDRMDDLEVNQHKQDLVLNAGRDSTQYLAVGKADGGAKIVVIFLHGWHGDRTLAMEDLRFGGNFNRLKNLMVLNDGVYVSPDFKGFFKRAARQITVLMKHFAANSPGAPIFIGCASTSCKTTYLLLDNPESAALMSGAVMFGSGRYKEFLDSPTFKDRNRWVPIYIGHGSDDKTNDWVTVELQFKAIKDAAPDYPIKFDLFLEGVHGTPIRMSDWRLVLNWMLEWQDKKGQS
jgi:hypothetical protein